jgi:hypothetical protein
VVVVHLETKMRMWVVQVAEGRQPSVLDLTLHAAQTSSYDRLLKQVELVDLPLSARVRYLTSQEMLSETLMEVEEDQGV